MIDPETLNRILALLRKGDALDDADLSVIESPDWNLPDPRHSGERWLALYGLDYKKGEGVWTDITLAIRARRATPVTPAREPAPPFSNTDDVEAVGAQFIERERQHQAGVPAKPDVAAKEEEIRLINERISLLKSGASVTTPAQPAPPDLDLEPDPLLTAFTEAKKAFQAAEETLRRARAALPKRTAGQRAWDQAVAELSCLQVDDDGLPAPKKFLKWVRRHGLDRLMEIK